jgi:hypothetical protein
MHLLSEKSIQMQKENKSRNGIKVPNANPIKKTKTMYKLSTLPTSKNDKVKKKKRIFASQLKNQSIL